MEEDFERWMSKPLPASLQFILVMATLGSVSVWLLFWFGD